MDPVKPSVALIATLGEQGGVQQFLLGFAHYLAKEGYPVTISTGDGHWLPEHAKQEGIPSHTFRHLGRAINPFRDMLALVELTRWLQKERPQVVHLNSAKAGIIGSIAARLAGIPRIIYRIGGWTFLEPMSSWRRMAYLLAERVTAPLKDVIICVHEGDAEIAKQQNIKPRERILCVPNGVDVEQLKAKLLSKEEARAALTLPTDDFVFGTVANFYPVKGLSKYVLDCKEVCEKQPRATFAIIGDGPERGKIEEAIRSTGFADRFHLVGAKEHASRYLNAFDIFVLPSLKEGMSWALLEAVAAGIPCIATDVGAAKTILQGSGLLVPVDQNGAMTEALLTAIRNPKSVRPSQSSGSIKDTYAGNERALLTSLAT